MSNILFPEVANYKTPFDTNSFLNEKNPFEKESLFYVPNFSEEGDVSISDWNYTFVILDSGTEVIERYEEYSKENQISDNSIVIFYEDTIDKANFFGTVCRVVMGSKMKTFIAELTRNKKDLEVNGKKRSNYNLTSWLKEVISQEKERNNNDVNNTVVELAILFELFEKNKKNSYFEELLVLPQRRVFDFFRNGLVKLIALGAEGIGTLKLKANNYEPNYKNYKPLIPIGKIEATTNNIAAFTNNVSELLSNTYFESIIEYFPWLEKVVYQIKEFIENARNFLDKLFSNIKNGVLEFLKLYNAFNCGIINGLISTIQAILLILGFILENLPYPAVFGIKSTKENIDKFETVGEFAEDFFDIIKENGAIFFKNILNGIKNWEVELPKLIDSITKAATQAIDVVKSFLNKVGDKLSTFTRYKWAYISGAIVFEILVDIVLAILTGGTSLIVQAANKISRVASKIGRAGAKAGTKIATTSVAVLKALRNFFKELLEAISNGKFIEFLKTKIDNLFGLKPKLPQALSDKLDDAYSKIRNPYSTLNSKKRIKIINEELNKSDRKYNFNKKALRDIDVKIPKSKNGLSPDFKKTPYLYRTKPPQKNIVKIKLTGDSTLDAKLAHELSRIPKSRGYTWHHVDDFNPITGEATMQYVKMTIHRKTCPHMGAVKQFEEFMNIKYKGRELKGKRNGKN